MKIKRVVIYCFVATMLAVLGASLLPVRSILAAGSSAQWQDKSTISYNGQTFIDNKPEDSAHIYYKDGIEDPQKCADTIQDFNNGDITKATQAKTIHRQTPLGSGGLGGGAGLITCNLVSTTTVDIDQASLGNANNAAGSSRGVAAGTTQANTCEKAGALAWIMCPFIKALDLALNWIDTQIQALLEIDKSSYTNVDLYRAWSQIRNFAYIVLIPIMLVMVLGTAMGSELFSAYTVKKALPRMAAAILFIALSYYICTFLIGFANVVGGGTMGLLTSPFNHLVCQDVANCTKTVGNTGLTELFGSGKGALASIFFIPELIAVAAGVLIIAWLFGVTILLFAGTAFLVLLLRQVFVLALLLVAPLAILAWIFPGNDKLWKTWWGSFSKLLIMFPLIVALIAVGRDMAWIVNTGGAGNGGLQGAFIKPIAKLLLYMLPYAFIPFTFKFAGGAFATISGMANDKGKGIFDRQRKKRAEKLERTAQGNLFKGKQTGARGFINRRGGDVMHLGDGGINPLKMKSRLASARSTRITAQSAKAAESAAVQAVVKNDDLLQASMHGDGSEAAQREYLSRSELGMSGEEINQAIASIQQAKREVGAEAFNDLAAAANAGTGTGYGAGPADMLSTINRVAGGDRQRATRILAGARGNAERARRADLYGAGFSTSSKQMQAMFNAGAQDDTAEAWHDANKVMGREALRTKSPGEIASGRNNALLNLMPAILERLDDSTNEVFAAHSAQDTARQNGTWTQAHGERVKVAEREHKRILAHTESMRDVAGQVSEENSQTIGERIMARDTVADGIITHERVAGTDMKGAPIYERSSHAGKVRVSVQQAVDGTAAPIVSTSNGQTQEIETRSIRGDEDFTRFRKEYSQPTSAAAAAAAAGAVGPPGGGLPPPGQIPGAPLPGAH